MAGITYTIGADGKPLMEAMDTAQRAVERFKKNVTNNEAAVRVAKLQTDADKARVAGQELLAKKIENEIALEQRLIAIRHSGATQAQKDDLEDHARTQRVLADRQAEINQAQKLANIQRGNMPGQPMSDGAKRFRMMNVSAQLQDVAVQAQMGTAMSTIVGQQAPQLISALGGTGAMAGAAAGAAISIAIVAGITQAADATHKAFQNMVTDSRTAGAEISKIIGGARNQKDIVSGLEKGEQAMKNIRAQEDMLYKGGAGNGFNRAMIRINSFVASGPTIDEVGQATAKERSAQEFYRVELNKKSLYLSGEQVKLSKMIADGDERGATILGRKLKMESESFEILNSKLGPNERLAADAALRAQFAAEELDIEKNRIKSIERSLSDSTASVAIDKVRLSGNYLLADELERQLKLTRDIQAINDRKDMTPADQAAAINAVSEKAATSLELKQKEIAKHTKESLADSAAENEIAKLRLNGEYMLATEKERQLKLAKEIAAIEDKKDLSRGQKDQLIAAANSRAQTELETKKQEQEKTANEAIKNAQTENELAKARLSAGDEWIKLKQIEITLEKELAALADRKDLTNDQKAKLWQAAQDKAQNGRNQAEKDAQDKGAAKREEGIQKLAALRADKRKSEIAKLTKDEQYLLSKHELEKAKNAYKRSDKGPEAQAELLEKSKDHEAVREAQIQRAMSGSHAEAAEKKAERAEQRSRARAERIIANRERTEKRAEMQRQGFSTKVIDEAISQIPGGAVADNSTTGAVNRMNKELSGVITEKNGLLDNMRWTADRLSRLLVKLTVA